MAKEISNKNRKATMEELLNAKAAMEKEKRNFGIPEEVISRDYTVIFDENDKGQAPKILIVISDDDDSSEDEERKEIPKRWGKENIPIINISDDSSEDSSDNDSSDNEDCVFHQKL